MRHSDTDRTFKPKGRIPLFWSIATPDQKEEENQREFSRIRDTSERVKLDEEISRQIIRARGRGVVRDRVSRFREREREKTK